MTSEESHLLGGVGVVTGAGSGIGRAIAHELARRGSVVYLVGRRAQILDLLALEIGSSARPIPADVTVPADLNRLAEAVAVGGRIDVLVHCAARYVRGSLAEVPAEDFDAVLRTNVVAPYALTRLLLPPLVAAGGSVVFMNSTAGMNTTPGISAYSSSKHALRAFADCLRDEVNADGVRVLSVFPGRTDTPLQEEIHLLEGRIYDTRKLVPARDVARATLDLLELSRATEVTDIVIRPSRKL